MFRYVPRIKGLQIRRKIMDKLKQELNELIDQYGALDSRVLAKSQELDIEIVKEMKEYENS